MSGPRLWLWGLLSGLVAAVAATVTFLLAEGALDIELLRPSEVGGTDAVPLELAHVVVVAIWVAICATGLLHLLLAATARAVSVFVWTSVIVVALSLVPVLALDADGDVKLMQVLLHVVVAVPIVAILRRAAADPGSAIVLAAREAQSRSGPDGQTQLVGRGAWPADVRGRRLAAGDDRLVAQGIQIVDVVGMEQFSTALASSEFDAGRHLLVVPDRSQDDAVGVWDAVPNQQIGWLPPEDAAAVATSLGSGEPRRATSLVDWCTETGDRQGLTIAVAPGYLSAPPPTAPTWAWLSATALIVILGAVGVMVFNSLGEPPDSDADQLIADMNDGVAEANDGLATTTDLFGELLAGVE